MVSLLTHTFENYLFFVSDAHIGANTNSTASYLQVAFHFQHSFATFVSYEDIYICIYVA